MLKKSLEFTHSDPKVVFWLSWILFAILLLPRILEKFRWHPAGGTTDPWQFRVLIFLVVLTIFAGWPLWKMLQKEKFSSVRESAVVVLGFLPIQILILIPLVIAAEVIDSTSHLEIEWHLVMTGIAISSFAGGCWIGFKKTRMTWLWCLLGLLFFWVPFVIEGINWNTTEYIKSLFWTACVAAGGYFGRWVSLGDREKKPHASAV